MEREDRIESHVRSEQIFGSSKKIQFIGLSKPARQQPQKDQMSIESLLTTFSHPRQSQTASDNDVSIDNLLTCDTKRKWQEPHTIRKKLKRNKVVCYYSAVAQKSYGSEKRFLCPPPLVHVDSRKEDLELSMSILCEEHGILEQRTILDEQHSGTFRYLHVTGTAKAKQFQLQLSLLQNEQLLASFLSKPISIISKPSKKTSKTSRTGGSSILANSHVSLFNRINSQTARTKYMTCNENKLCAKNSTWSPFDIIVIRQPKQIVVTQQSKSSHRYNTSRLQLQKNFVSHLTYGTEIILRESLTGVSSPPLTLCKVDRGRIVAAHGPVSQMQKIALRLVSSDTPIYLSAAGSMTDQDHSWLDYSPSRQMEGQEIVDDYLCWTIIGIHTLEDEFDEDRELKPRLHTPYPFLSHIEYRSETNTLEVVGQHLIQAAPVPRLLELWAGTQGPLPTRISRPPQAHSPHETHWSVQLSSITIATELPLLLIRQDGLVYHTGKFLIYDKNTWLCK
ncbi:beta-trefoil DNA-binding domain-containing protein [Sporodiniella umbellata]|nr:beta-trefoil DNA-binding domain-containing protein [Sporodiniella umbellata]